MALQPRERPHPSLFNTMPLVYINTCYVDWNVNFRVEGGTS